jgi:4-aminobutyrate aminotransferase-like enzyme
MTGHKSSADIKREHDEFLFPCVANYYKEPIALTSGKGCVVEDADGSTYLDFFGGILTVSIGHTDDRINSAVIAQMNRLGHTSTLFPNSQMVDLARRLARITPGKLKKCFFTTSGTEADETAVMMAQAFTGSSEIIALRHGYSGRSLLAQSLTAHAPWRGMHTQVAAVKHALNPYCYRCPLGLKYPSCEIKCATDIEDLIQTTTYGSIAGFLAEPIQGVGGFITPPKEYFKIAVDIIRKYGGIFICDEVQTGFGRTGGKMFGIEHFGVEPEMMTMAKGIANGMPIGATITTDKIAASFKKNSISTFGGNPVSCAAANATLDIIETDDIPARSEKAGTLLRTGLDELAKKHPKLVGDVRGMGLMQAVELVVDETTGDRTPNADAALTLFEETKKRGLLVGKGGLHGNVIRISPPMSVSDLQIKDAVAILDESLAAIDD